MRITKIFIFLLCSPAAIASGWNDYVLDLGNGYQIYRANSFDIGLMKNNSPVVSGFQYKEMGPITDYFVTDYKIYIRASGWKYRGKFEGDTLKEKDDSIYYYFITDVETSNVIGPLRKKEFSNLVVGEVSWVQPKNPSTWVPIIGALFFILVSIPILYVKFWYVSVPITVLLLFVYMHRKRVTKVCSGFENP